ncbi:MAG: patatin-like phospholipase family protein [Balneolaceae bacterium]
MDLSSLFNQSNKKLGLALGAAHVGVLKAFAENELTPAFISGTSIGAFVAAHIAYPACINQILFYTC